MTAPARNASPLRPAAARRPPSPLLAALAAELPDLPAGRACACALSGGLDSSALLAAAALRYGPSRVAALHVNHGLSDTDDAFEIFCEARAREIGSPFQALRVDGRPRPGQSPEEAARDARYLALSQSSEALGAAFCLLAQHAADQAETLLLALSRGLGLPGLSGMGAWRQGAGALFHRPWLAVPRADILAAARESGVAWSEDPSNSEERFLRNRLRARAMPALIEALPGFEKAAARSMGHCAQAQELLDEVALSDMRKIPDMDLAALRSLSRPRLANLLRAWSRKSGLGSPGQTQLDEALSQIEAAARGGGIDIRFGIGRLSRVGPRLAAEPPASEAP